MVQMTLQRAQHVFNRIKAETAFATAEEEDPYAGYGRRRPKTARNTFTLSINVSVDHPVRQQADAYRALALDKLDKMFALMEIGTRIRTATTEKQAHAGITALVTRRVMIVQQIQILDHLLQSVETGVYVPEMVENQAELIKKRLDSSASNTTTANISTVVLTSEDRVQLTTKLTASKSTLMWIDDHLATMNATNHIEVSTEDNKVLQETGLAA